MSCGRLATRIVSMSTNRFEYDGPVYIKPIGRGIVLEQTKTFLNDEIERLVEKDIASGWEGRLKIVVEAVPGEAQAS